MTIEMIVETIRTHRIWTRLETSRLKRLLTDVATVGAESHGTYRLGAHDISEAVQALDGQDPPEWRIEDPERRSAVGSAMHRVRERMRRIPGTAADGKIATNALAAKYRIWSQKLAFEYLYVATTRRAMD